MKNFLFLFLALALGFQAKADNLSKSIDLFKNSSKSLNVSERDFVNFEINDEFIVMAYFSVAKQKVVAVEEDLGIGRINDYIIREVKNRNPKQTKSPNPLSLSEVQHAFRFISNQLFNIVPTELRTLLKRSEVKLHFSDIGLSNRLNEFVSLAHIDTMTDQLLITSIYNGLGQNDTDLVMKGYVLPEVDMTRQILAYTILNHFGIYTASIKAVD